MTIPSECYIEKYWLISFKDENYGVVSSLQRDFDKEILEFSVS